MPPPPGPLATLPQSQLAAIEKAKAFLATYGIMTTHADKQEKEIAMAIANRLVRRRGDDVYQVASITMPIARADRVEGGGLCSPRPEFADLRGRQQPRHVPLRDAGGPADADRADDGELPGDASWRARSVRL